MCGIAEGPECLALGILWRRTGCCWRCYRALKLQHEKYASISDTVNSFIGFTRYFIFSVKITGGRRPVHNGQPSYPGAWVPIGLQARYGCAASLRRDPENFVPIPSNTKGEFRKHQRAPFLLSTSAKLRDRPQTQYYHQLSPTTAR